MRVVFGRPNQCLNKLAKGAIKRVPAWGALIGYFLRCPECAARSVHLHDEVQFDESTTWVDDVIDGIRFQRPESISAKKQLACHGCAKTWMLRDGQLTQRG